ncbi:hypothetical protein [Faecalibacter rhinopitheci]|uniref:DUF4362 domain-containing protein n=1 Tax=Faecalibacter rhinopitheci TaxID=2779678 RepID=A0A8J7FT03_9FLAO|nr:hypothetical protein [Faecalibacter rhinopitheci]MBF0598378.1 hypothetical protein [Faecalibacter rhinopitheci]
MNYKKLLIIVLSFLHYNCSAQNNNNCNLLEQLYDEPTLECLNKKQNSKNIYLQFFEWQSFAQNTYLLRIQKINNNYKIIHKEIHKPKYDSVNDTWKSDYKTLINKKIKKKEFFRIKEIIESYNFSDFPFKLQTEDGMEFFCSDGKGIIFYYYYKGVYNDYSNGNCGQTYDSTSKIYENITNLLNIETHYR